MTGTTPARRSRKIAMVAIGLATTAIAAMAPAVAAAESLWVSSAPTTAGNGSGCSRPGYNAIQAAIEKASEGAAIHVCAGTYAEQLKMTSPVSLKAAGGGSVTVKLPPTPANSTTACGEALSSSTQAVIDICGGGSFAISGLQIEGNWPAGTCNNNLYDVLAAGGATLSITGSSVLGAGATPIDGCQGGIGVQIGDHHITAEGLSHAAAATLSKDTVKGYQKNGIDVDGSGSTAALKDVTVEGAGETNVIAQNGIEVSNEAAATIVHSSVTHDQYEGEYSATGIIFYKALTGSSVKSSRIASDDIGIDYEESGTSRLTVSGSSFESDRYAGVFLAEGDVVANKDRFNGGEDAIALYQYAGEHSGPTGGALGDTVENMSSYAVIGYSDKAAGDPAGSFTIEKSKISGNPPGADVAESVFSESPTLVITAARDS